MVSVWIRVPFSRCDSAAFTRVSTAQQGVNQVNRGCTLMYQYELGLKRSHPGTDQFINELESLILVYTSMYNVVINEIGTYWYVPVYTLIKSTWQYISVCTGKYFWTKFHTGINALVHRQSQAGLYEYEVIMNWYVPVYWFSSRMSGFQMQD